MKRKYVILIIIPVLLISAYLYLRFSVLRSKDFKPDLSKSRSIADLRPQLIAKLQQLVKDGSAGLYKLQIDDINVKLSNGGISINEIILLPDSNFLATPQEQNQKPGDIFKFKADSLIITGMGLAELLDKDKLDLTKVYIRNFMVEVYHTNGPGPAKNPATLYEKIRKQFKKISIKEIALDQGTIIIHDISKNKISTINDLTIRMNDLLIDSSTQNDKSRFLFAKDAAITTTNYIARSSDSLYFFKFGSIRISTAANNMILQNIKMEPRLSKQQFEAKLSSRKIFYNVSIPEITLSGIDWWQLANGQSILAKEAVINKGILKLYLDRSLPFAVMKQNNFPHQQLMRLPIPVHIPKTVIRHLNLEYSEYNPRIEKTGTLYLDDINGTLLNLTNIPEQIKQDPQMVLQSSGLFMHKVLLQNTFRFDLSKYNTGNFTLSLEAGRMDSAILNPLIIPVGEFMIKKGI
ncbi:MAG: hypothetical protein ABJA85_02670, partial [Bacteroidota bacterium]